MSFGQPVGSIVNDVQREMGLVLSIMREIDGSRLLMGNFSLEARLRNGIAALQKAQQILSEIPRIQARLQNQTQQLMLIAQRLQSEVR